MGLFVLGFVTLKLNASRKDVPPYPKLTLMLSIYRMICLWKQ